MPSKRRRACEACHAAKVRCELSIPKSQSIPPCKRCRKAGRECFPATPRLQRNRIAALEAQVQALAEALEVQRSIRAPLPLPTLPDDNSIAEHIQEHPDVDVQIPSSTAAAPLIQLAFSLCSVGPSLPQPTDLNQARNRTVELKRHIDSWSASAPQSASEPLSVFHRHIAILYLNEVILHTPSNKVTFQPPYIPERIAAADFAAPVVTIDHIGALYAVKNSCHAALEKALDIEPANYPSLVSEAFYIRVQYAMFVLIKLYVAVTAPGNTYGTVLSKAELCLEAYLDRIKDKVTTPTVSDPISPQSINSAAFGLLEDWFIRYKAIVEQYERRMSLDLVWTPSMTTAVQKFGIQVQSSDHAIGPNDLIQIDANKTQTPYNNGKTQLKQYTWKHSQLPRMESCMQEHFSSG